MILAIAVKGKEYLYKAETAHYVSKSSADFICKTLNDNKYNLKDGEVWHKYDRFDYTSPGNYFAGLQRFAKYKNSVRDLRRRP